jgi:hypothetical protein
MFYIHKANRAFRLFGCAPAWRGRGVRGEEANYAM